MKAIYFILTLPLAGCGGGGGGDSSSSSLDENGDARVVNSDSMYSVQSETFDRFSEASITEETVEDAVKLTAKELQWWIRDLIKYSYSSDDSTRTDLTLEKSGSYTESCSEHGESTISMDASTQLVANLNGYRVITAGDQMSYRNDLCGEILNGSDITTINGVFSREILEGVSEMSFVDPVILPTTIKTIYKKFYLAAYGTIVYQYQNGERTDRFTSDGQTISSAKLEMVDSINFHQIHSVFTDVEVTIGEYEIPYWSYSLGTEMRAGSVMSIEARPLKLKVNIEVTEALRIDDVRGNDIGSGKYLLQSAGSKVAVRFMDDYLEYELDRDGDDFYEVSGIIDDAYY